jgi:hypothetical protein
MATAKELRESITKNREALKAAIEASAAKWETAAGDGSSPRQNAEQAIGSDLKDGQQAAAILGGNPPPAVETSFATAADAVAALSKIGPEIDKRFSWAEDRDLSKAQGGNTLESIFTHAMTNLAETAEKIKAGS